MQILGRLYPLLSVFSFLGFQNRFLQSILRGFILMDFVICLQHLSQDYNFGCGFFVFASFKEVSETLGLFLLFAFGLKSLYSPWFSRYLVQFLFDLREKSAKSKTGFYSENVLDENLGLLTDVPLNDIVEASTKESTKYPSCDRKMNREFDEEYDVDIDNDDVKDYTDKDDEFSSLYSVNDDELQTGEDSESDVSALRKLIKIERRRANVAFAELVNERAASATAAEEAMAMIMRLQNEKSSIEMESIQYQRLAEEKQIHDQEVIQSFQWLVWRNESEICLLQEELKLCRRKLNQLSKSDEGVALEEEVEEAPSGYTYTDGGVEDVLYSSLDFDLSPK